MKQLTGVLNINNKKYDHIINIINKPNNYCEYETILEEVLYLDDDYACTLKTVFDFSSNTVKTIILIHFGDKDVKTEIFYNEFKTNYLIKTKENIEVLINIEII